MKTFTAIDFETAQGYRWSICQVGLVHVVNGELVKKIELFVQPPNNYYWKQFVDIHGISWQTTEDAPTFDTVWTVMEPYIRHQEVVAHNGAFDFNCLQQTLELYQLEMPEFTKHCTYRLYGRSLADLCEIHAIKLDHHHALSDALACAELFMRYQKVG